MTAFAAKIVAVAPGHERRYVAEEWSDALVVVERGELELECVSGVCRRFGEGSFLWLSGLPLRTLRSVGNQSVLLVAISRRARVGDEFVSRRVSVCLDTRPPRKEARMFVWFDLHSEKLDAGNFYTQLLGWSIEQKGDSHAMIAGENGPWAAIVAHGREDAAWVPYVQVEDLHEAHRRAVELGGTVLQEPTEGPAGRYSTIRDTGGAPLALFQPRG